jgi:tetratricopeptide (TPR) repeat protein
LTAELDPTMTERAIDQFLLFMRLHPESEHVPAARERVNVLRGKLAEKAYLNGRLYIKLKEPEAARFYFDIVTSEYPESQFASKALLGGGRAYEMEGNKTSAIGRYKELVRIFPQSEEAAQARARLRELGAEGPDSAEGGSGGASDDGK